MVWREPDHQTGPKCTQEHLVGHPLCLEATTGPPGREESVVWQSGDLGSVYTSERNSLRAYTRVWSAWWQLAFLFLVSLYSRDPKIMCRGALGWGLPGSSLPWFLSHTWFYSTLWISCLSLHNPVWFMRLLTWVGNSLDPSRNPLIQMAESNWICNSLSPLMSSRQSGMLQEKLT